MNLSLHYSAHCPQIAGTGHLCMIDGETPATGHVTVVGGPHDGRCIAVVCELHASPAGAADVKARLVEWLMADLLSPTDLGPGADGAPEVWHVDHLDPLPEHRH